MIGLKKWGAIAIGVLIAGAIGIVGLIALSRGGNAANQIDVYFFNPTARRMEAEARQLPEGNFQVRDVIGYLHTGPVRSVALVNTWPLELAQQPEDLISSVVLEDSTLFAFFSPVFYDMAALEQSLFKAAFINTMQGIPSISDITIIVTDNYSYAYEAVMRSLQEGEGDTQTGDYDENDTPYMPLVIYDNTHAGVLLDPLDPPISPGWIEDVTFNYLHFVDTTGTGLVVETHYAEDIDRRPQSLAEYALQFLIDGSRQEGVLSLIPPETRILNLEIIDSDVYVNLSIDFVNRFTGGQELAGLMIQSIVNTLIAELRSPTRVFFWIETQQLEEFHGVPDFNTYFVRDNTMMLAYIEALGYEYDYEYEPVEE